GRDTYHHTFFEMLGNWSFGDYYKKEAIQWGWELLTEVWGLPKERLWATVYRTDDESFELWKTVTDIKHDHILHFNEKDNFWEMGETGPCGPCSEIHVDLTADGNADASMVNAGLPELIEIWNLVFIQHNRRTDGTLEDLPAKHVDTGMGFERVCAVMHSMKSDFKRPPSNYDSDVFMPLISGIASIADREYTAGKSEQDVAMRVIADHVRALTFAIADGAIPSNEGRGYVLRRILRRAARFGRTIGMHDPFIYKLVKILVEMMSATFPEIAEHQELIERVIRSEEESFNQTLDRGLEIFESVVRALGSSTVFPADEAFKLYDTFGFPLDLTELLCAERTLTIEAEAFQHLMERQRDRSRESGKMSGAVFGGGKITAKGSAIPASRFVGYETLEQQASIVGTADEHVALDRTPFYAESGGQVGDTGVLMLGTDLVPVEDTQKDGSIIWHKIAAGRNDLAGNIVTAKVDAPRREAIMSNHSATHLLHAALRSILGTHVHQSGSLVSAEHLRFDFAHFARVTPEELNAIEEQVNDIVARDIAVQHHIAIPFEEAQKMGALMFFGDKYGDRVNVIEFDNYSKEFCGGTHVSHTGQIGYFKVRSESSIASGVRRIEALTSAHALDYLAIQHHNYRERVEFARERLAEIAELASQLPVALHSRFAVSDETIAIRFEKLSSLPASVVTRALQEGFSEIAAKFRTLEEFILELGDRKRTAEKELSRTKISSAGSELETLVAGAEHIGPIAVVAAKIEADSMDSLKSLGDALRTKLGSGVGVLAAVIEEKVALVCVVTDDLVAGKKLQAGKIVGAIAKILGGGGGGKPHLATAGGKDVTKIDEALKAVADIVRSGQ
ncbi:MAG: alanine--tRNA ligase, partial [Ignavibacteriales bacterium]|nr:alanine--tRNA ligase [Ignavibacteriales bacterium]